MKMNHGCAGLGLFAIGLLVPAAAQAMSEAEFQKIADAALAPVMAEYDIPGLGFGVTWQGESYVHTAGLADRDGDVPVTDKTLFELGSISKLFNATLAGLADGQGRLSLNDPVSGHFPELKGSAFDRISLMDLATHQTSGLPLQVPDEVGDDADLMRWLQDWQPIPQSGHERSYSNISIGLLGRATANAFGQDYATAVRDHLLHPLGLDSTHVNVPSAQMSDYAFGYTRDTDQPVRVNPGVLDAEAYGMKSSVTDMLHFLQVNLGDVEVSADIAAAVTRAGGGQTKAQHFTQAMIWQRDDWPVSRDALLAGNSQQMVLESTPATRLDQPDTRTTGVMFGKTGSTNGFGGYVAFIPDEDLGVVFLANRNIPLPARIEASLAVIDDVLEADE